MAAGKYNFTIEQGATTDFEIQYKDSNNQAVDLSHYTGRLQIRPNFADNTASIFLTLSSSRNGDGTGLNFSGSSGTKSPTEGCIGVFIAACTSSQLTFNQGLYDLELYSGSGECAFTIRLIQGTVKVSKEVTRV